MSTQIAEKANELGSNLFDQVSSCSYIHSKCFSHLISSSMKIVRFDLIITQNIYLKIDNYILASNAQNQCIIIVILRWIHFSLSFHWIVVETLHHKIRERFLQ